MRRLVALAVFGYAAAVICLWLAVDLLTDRAWPATLVAFGPRWLAALPLLPLALIVVFATPGRVAVRLIGAPGAHWPSFWFSVSWTFGWVSDVWPGRRSSAS